MNLFFFNNLSIAENFSRTKFPLSFNLFFSLSLTHITRAISSRFPTFHLITTPSVQYIQRNKPELILKRATWHANMESNKALAPNLRGPREEAGIQVIMSFSPLRRIRNKSVAEWLSTYSTRYPLIPSTLVPRWWRWRVRLPQYKIYRSFGEKNLLYWTIVKGKKKSG